MLRNKLITCFRKCAVSYGNVILIFGVSYFSTLQLGQNCFFFFFVQTVSVKIIKMYYSFNKYRQLKTVDTFIYMYINSL